jgi:hypothetical protein
MPGLPHFQSLRSWSPRAAPRSPFFFDVVGCEEQPIGFERADPIQLVQISPLTPRPAGARGGRRVKPGAIRCVNLGA